MFSLLVKNSCKHWAQKNYYYEFSSSKNQFILLKMFYNGNTYITGCYIKSLEILLKF